MAQLVIRRLDPEVVMELRKRAARSGRSMEAGSFARRYALGGERNRSRSCCSSCPPRGRIRTLTV
jgi:plasmid stability protein